MTKTAIPFIATAGERYCTDWIGALQAAMPDERIVALRDLGEEERKTCTLAIVANPDPADLERLPRLFWVHSVWAGVERLLAALGKSDLRIVRLVDPQMAETMAEAVLAWTLYLHRDMPAYARQQQQKTWKERPYLRPQQRSVGILGLGALGSAAAARLRDAGFRVLGWSRQQKSLTNVECFAGADGLAAMLPRTDILVCLLPLTPDTRNLLDAARLALLPSGASLINFARAPIINEDDLRAALDRGDLEHAVLDVFAIEPLPAESWPWQHPRVTVLPHCTAPTDRQTASAIVAANILRYRETGEIPRSVDPERGY